MAKAKKPTMTWKDTLPRWLFGLSALLGIVCLVPVVPWRRALQTPVFHSRFMQYRAMSLVSMTDKNTAYQPFTKWKREMCMLMRTYQTPDLLSSLAGAAGTVFAQKSGFSPATLMGCRMWETCKAQVSTRCYGYTTMVGLGFAVMAMILVSVGSAIAVPCMIASDVAIKASGKKKIAKKESAMFSTMICSFVALFFSMSALGTYHFVSDSVFNGFQSGAYWPYPAAGIGYFICCAMIFFQVLGSLVTTLRVYGGKGGKEKGEDDGEDEQGTQSLAPGPGMGGSGAPWMMSGAPQPRNF